MEEKKERSFGLSVGAVCGILAAYFLWRGRGAAAVVFGLLALGLVVPALVKSNLLRIPSALWWRFSQILGWINTRVLLSVLFFLVLAPIGVVLRLVGWDAMNRRKSRDTTGWMPYAERRRDCKHYERMY